MRTRCVEQLVGEPVRESTIENVRAPSITSKRARDGRGRPLTVLECEGLRHPPTAMSRLVEFEQPDAVVTSVRSDSEATQVFGSGRVG